MGSAMNLQSLSLVFLATVAVGGAAWVFLYPVLSGEKQAENRRREHISVGELTRFERIAQGAAYAKIEQKEKACEQVDK